MILSDLKEGDKLRVRYKILGTSAVDYDAQFLAYNASDTCEIRLLSGPLYGDTRGCFFDTNRRVTEHMGFKILRKLK